MSHLTTTTKDGAEVQPGDVIRFLGSDRLVTELVPASATTCELVGDPAARFACSRGGWSITVHQGQRIEVVEVAR